MNTITRRTFLALTAAGLAAGMAHAQPQAQPQDWPQRPIRIIVSQPPGAAPDILARLLGDKMAKTLGQPIIVENRPGSGNIIGAQAAARATPDGYTYYLATTAPLAVNPYTFKSLPYDPVKDFAPVGMVGGSYFYIAVNNDVPVKTLEELIALAKSQPEKISFSSDGTKGFAGIMGEWINKRAGIKMLHVPYTSAAQSLQETIAGRTQVTIQATPVAMPFVNRGAIRPIAITSPQKVEGFNVPPVAQTLPGVQMFGWLAFVTQKDVPAPIVAKFNQALDKALKEPDMKKRIDEMGFTSEGAGTPAALGQYIKAEYERWGKITSEIGMVAD
ncbi:Tripartite-type tricarboxylate transporter, receptor component TctC [Noviherbaspirillum humi]|uniref:Tripartite-type tricarboxylate transporter, receptor component TctC n=1 Tax=Noviherbaspirillum humi TaxID=1688639 RepID=A0A239LVG5_9BURK|nr:tripartite tricarboxylate transporter substrate binding protein [Noviherbaspirillum humi]SNT34667.1 Tripartite-type tricarboxylate transporter, receptor component TctC [Noviherbaspirillum humi]